MRPPRSLAVLAVLTLLFPAPVPALQTDSTRSAATSQRPLLAVGQTLLINVFVNRFDAWALREDWAANAGSQSWSRNIRLGWEWDENSFSTNLFAHPYHGGLYFNAGRSNGLDYWESATLALLGSWTWEYFGESNRPSLNDFFMTSIGGIALGEVFHRVGATIRDNGATGRRRTWREIAALPFDPMGGVNRLLRGQWTARGPNPPEHDLGAFLLRVHGGARIVADSITDSVATLPVAIVDLRYGDPLRRPYGAPFDVFGARIMVSSAGLNALRTAGRLFGTDLNRPAARHRHAFAVNQRFDFISNPAHQIGGQSVEAGFYSLWQLGRGFGVRTQVFGSGILLGAIDAPGAGFGERNYDFGPGAGLRLELGLERRGVTFLTVHSQAAYVHAVSGASADHYIGFGGVELTVPIVRRLGLGVHATHFSRASQYSDRPDDARDFPELRLLLNWTAASRPAAAQTR
ncbi:MAG TPA: DUF3943 domain-containing protein [Gemmatimonadales bacterium]